MVHHLCVVSLLLLLCVMVHHIRALVQHSVHCIMSAFHASLQGESWPVVVHCGTEAAALFCCYDSDDLAE